MSNSIWRDIPTQFIKSGALYVGPGLIERAIQDANEIKEIAEKKAKNSLKSLLRDAIAKENNDIDLKSIIEELEDISSEELKVNQERINDERRHIEWNKKSVSSTTNNIVGNQSLDDYFPNGAIRNLET